LTENPGDSKFCKECATPLPPLDQIKATSVKENFQGSKQKDHEFTKTLETPIEKLTTGSTFAGRYQIIEELGKGGMGRVYKAVDTKINEKIALKLIRPEIASDKKSIERFGNELKYSRKISHRNICRMYDLGEDQGNHFITMEYVSGEDLKSMLRMMGRMSPAQTVSIGKQICEGLVEAHRLGVVHRDLKPNNIMIDREGNARIMDFGIARVLKTKGMTGTGIMIGTPEYMSPEQAEAKEVDQRSDIYSLGVILFEMVTGQLPFHADSPLAVAMKHKGEMPKDPREINTQIPEDLSAVILKCLEKEKDNRYQSAAEIRSEMEKLEKGLPTTSRIIPNAIPSTSREITVSFQPKKLLIPAFTVIAIAVLVFLILQFLPQKKPIAAKTIENSLAVISFENQTGDEKYDYLRKAIPNLIITNLENTGFFYVATWERLHDLLKQMGKKDIAVIDRDLGFELCRREGIKYIVIGTFTKAGNTFATDVKVLDTAGKTLLKSASSQGDGEDSIIKAQIGELSREISRGIGIAREKIESVKLRVADVTTISMEAYNYYLQGVEYIDKFYFPEALQNIERALGLDPEFSMAWLYLGNIHNHLQNGAARDEAYTKAYQLSAKTTEKERLFISAEYARIIEQDWEKGRQILEELVAKYPKEKMFHYELGVALANRGMEDEGLHYCQEAVRLDPEYGEAWNQIAYIQMRKKEFDKALLSFEKYAAIYPDDANPIDSMAELFLQMGQLDESLKKYKEVLNINPKFGSEWRIAYLYALKEDYNQAIHWIDQFIDPIPFPGIKAEAYLWKGYFTFYLGRFEESFALMEIAVDWAKKAENPLREFTLSYTLGFIHYDLKDFASAEKHFKEAETFIKKLFPGQPNPDVTVAYLFGMLEIEKGEILRAKERLKEIESRIDEFSPSTRQMANLLRNELQAKILVAEGLPDQAIPYFERVLRTDMPGFNINSMGPYIIPFTRDDIAQLYKEKGDLDKAITEYKWLIEIGPETNNRRLINPKYHFRLAQIYEEKGLKDKAVEHYQKFLELWKDADSGLPEKTEAQNRLAALHN